MSPTYVQEQQDIADIRRIVELKILGRQFWCVSCKEALSLEYIEIETRRGLCSQLLVRCVCFSIMQQQASSIIH
jgi:hypothetical protein